MVSELISRCIIIVFGLLYPAYCSYKAIKSRSSTLYVKWMMYWIVFALFYNVETIADLLISWFPMYYEMKAIFVIWLLSPPTQGSQVLYKMYIHPHLLKHEEEIEQTLERVKSQSYTTLLNVSAQGMNMALQGAIAGQTKLADQLRKSYSFDSTDSSQSLQQYISADEDSGDGDIIYDPLRSRYDTSSHNSTYRAAGVQRGGYIRGPARNIKLNSASPSVVTANATSQSAETGNKSSHTRNSQSTPGVSQKPRRPLSYPEPNTRGARIVSPVDRRPRSISERTATQRTSRHSSPAADSTTFRGRQSRPVALPEASRSSSTNTRAASSATSEVTAVKTPKKRFSESTLRYRTKKISDIKSHKIESPFISLF